MDEEHYMTLEQKMTLKAILEGDYNIERMSFEYVLDTNWLSVIIDGKWYRIHFDGKVTRKQEVEVEL